jgi:hypothetical protein
MFFFLHFDFLVFYLSLQFCLICIYEFYRVDCVTMASLKVPKNFSFKLFFSSQFNNIVMNLSTSCEDLKLLIVYVQLILIMHKIGHARNRKNLMTRFMCCGCNHNITYHNKCNICLVFSCFKVVI